MLSGGFDISPTQEPEPTGCCAMFKESQTSGTDNEGYGSLLRWEVPDKYAPDREEGWYIGDGLDKIKFCPWCASPVPGKPAEF